MSVDPMNKRQQGRATKPSEVILILIEERAEAKFHNPAEHSGNRFKGVRYHSFPCKTDRNGKITRDLKMNYALMNSAFWISLYNLFCQSNLVAKINKSRVYHRLRNLRTRIRLTNPSPIVTSLLKRLSLLRKNLL